MEVKETDQHTKTVCPFPLEDCTVISGFQPHLHIVHCNYSCLCITGTVEFHVS